MPNEPIIGVLLAGGQSRRMGGGDKCLKALAGRSLLKRIMERLAPQVGEMILNANGDPARFSQFDLPVTADPVEGYAGPLAGVLAGIHWTQANRPEAKWIITAATDTPFFPKDLVACLRSSAGDTYPAIVLASYKSRPQPVFGLWPTALADDLEEALRSGIRKVLDWTDRHSTTFVDFPSASGAGGEIDPFFNANRPEDMAEAERLVAAGSP
jgi:molybdopterin-guanine dinucleotide biosynthesis protein A